MLLVDFIIISCLSFVALQRVVLSCSLLHFQCGGQGLAHSKALKFLLDDSGILRSATSETTAAATCLAYSAQDSSPTECRGVGQVTPVTGCCVSTPGPFLLLDSRWFSRGQE